MSVSREQGGWRSGRLAAITVAATAFLLPATSLAAPGSLDRSFGDNGRLTIKAARSKSRGAVDVTRLLLIPMASAAGPKGELVAANDRLVLRYRADGRPQRHFGGDGRAKIPVSPGTIFQLAGVAVDSRGRVLVAGTTKPAGAGVAESLAARASVFRFMPNGKLDRSFGESGVAGVALNPLEATGLAVDSHDRPVLTGFSALTPSVCNTTPVYLNTTAVVRLTAGGNPDPSFGGGVFADSLEDPHLPVLTGAGRVGVAYISTPEVRCSGFAGESVGNLPTVSLLGPGGNLVHRFPAIPSESFDLIEVPSLAVDRQNRVVVLMSRSNPEGGNFHQQVHRLLPDGSPDPDFGVNYGEVGVISSPGPAGSHLYALTTDKRNRVLLAGTTPLGRKGHAFVAVRLSAAGKVQAGFGDEGAAKVGFGKQSTATASQIFLDSRGRIDLAGTVERHAPPTVYGLAFARLLSGG